MPTNANTIANAQCERTRRPQVNTPFIYLFVCIWFSVQPTSVLSVKRIRKIHNFLPARHDTGWRKLQVCNLNSIGIYHQKKLSNEICGLREVRFVRKVLYICINLLFLWYFSKRRPFSRRSTAHLPTGSERDPPPKWTNWNRWPIIWEHLICGQSDKHDWKYYLPANGICGR